MADLPKSRGIMSLFVRHATLANLVVAIMVVAGLFAIPRLRAQFFPDTVINSVLVTVAWDGAGAEDVDNSVVAVLEPALITVEGVSETSSRASEGQARIELEFETGTDISQAVADVETAIAGAGDLPPDADDPEVTRRAWRDGVADVVISGPVAPAQLGRIADDMLSRLFQQGITRASVLGVAAAEMVIEVPSQALIAHDLTLSEIAAAIGADTTPTPAGDVASGAARVRTGVERRDPAAVAATVLRTQTDGTALTVADVATITASGTDADEAYYVGADPAVVVQIQRAAAGDAIRMQRQVEAVLDEMRAGLPRGVTLSMIRTRAEMIESRLQLLLDNAMMGLGLVLLLLFLFLNARTAIWVAAGIPVSLLAAIAIMWAAGLTLNMISLFALILTLGIIVDDAIVVGEHADYRRRKLGEPAVVAAERAAQRMFTPVFSSTLTTIIAFAGLTMIGGRFGRMVSDIPATVIAVLIASLIECFLVLPNHMAHSLAHVGQRRWYDAPSRWVNRWLDRFVAAILRPALGLVIRLRYPVLAGAIAMLAWVISVLMTGQVPWRFFDAPERASISGNFAMLPGATRADTLEFMLDVQDAVTSTAERYEQEYGVNPVTFALAQIGSNSGRPLPGAENRDPDLLGAISVEMIDPDLRPYSSFEFTSDLQAAMPSHPRLEALSFRGYRSGPGGDAISVLLSGASTPQLKDAAEALKLRLGTYPEISAIEDSMPYDKDELVLNLTAQGRALGFTPESLSRDLRLRLSGIEAATFPDGARSGKIMVELPETELQGDFLQEMRLRSAAGQWVPLADIVTLEQRAGFSTILRENGLRQVTVTADLAGDDPARAADITEALQTQILPDIAAEFGVTTRRTGLAEQENEFLGDAAAGLGLALTGIYLVLAWIFASWTRPIIVMAVIPFGLIGAVWGHYLWALPLSMFSVVGLIGMSGIIINDSIVLISTVDEQAPRRGLRQAIIDAVAQRFRPVLLTTATTVLGLAPLLYERSSQALFLKPTVISLAYGLGFGLLIVLLIVPAALIVGADLGQARRALRRGLHAPQLRAPLWAAVAICAVAALVLLGPVVIDRLGGAVWLADHWPGWLPDIAGAGQALLLYALAVGLAMAVAVALFAIGQRRPSGRA